MILSCQNISKSFGENTVIKDASFFLEEKQKAAIVGINGAGKSTLLKIIMKEMRPDSGTVTFSKGLTIGYLSQHQAVIEDRTIYQELLSVKQEILNLENLMRSLERQMKGASPEELETLMNRYSTASHEFELQNGYAYKSEIVGVLKGLGFTEEDYDRETASLSGGQKTRVALGKLLLSKPELLILDEPTNHLDMNSIAWLEGYLQNYFGSVLIVAHDRYFLDRVVTKVIEMENGISTSFSGNYTAYAAKKAMLRDAQMKAYINQQREIAHQEAVIEKLKSFNREKSIKRAESREKALDKIQRLEQPVELNDKMRITLEPAIVSGNDVLHVEGLSKSFTAEPLFADISFDIKRGERVAIIGNNGTGKTTILKIINDLLEPDCGIINLGSKVEIAYYDQEHHVLHMEKTLFEEISDEFPTLDNTRIRNVLAAFLFTGDDVFKQIRDLSGGERGRVSLAKLMLSDGNFLILDEPTNHLDIASKEILEDALNNYTGTVLYVSHDRYFINRTATRILDLTGGMMIPYLGNYDYYLEKRDEQNRIHLGTAVEAAADPAAPSEGKLDWKQQKEDAARIRKLQNELSRLEKRIEELEQRQAQIDDLLSQEEVFTNVARCIELGKEKEANDEELLSCMERWEELSGALDEADA